jgi:peptidoglycan hydrolase-like protein with peptidoglycan-binding domain
LTDSPFLPPLEEAASKNSMLLKGKGRPSANVSRRERRVANRVPAKDSDFEKKHPRGTGEQGGQWIAKGTSGPAVRAIQRKVGATPDGAFGPRTAASVRAYQQKNGLKVDGIVGRETAASMLGASRIPKPGELRPGQRKALRGLSRRKRTSPTKARRTGGGLKIL